MWYDPTPLLDFTGPFANSATESRSNAILNPAVELYGCRSFRFVVILQGGTKLSTCATLPPQVSCSVHCVLASHIPLQGLQHEGGLIHSEKPTAKRESGHQAGETSSRTQTDPICTPPKCL